MTQLELMHESFNDALVATVMALGGYELRPLETELERRLRQTTERAEKAEDRLRYLEDLHTRGTR